MLLQRQESGLTCTTAHYWHHLEATFGFYFTNFLTLTFCCICPSSKLTTPSVSMLPFCYVLCNFYLVNALNFIAYFFVFPTFVLLWVSLMPPRIFSLLFLTILPSSIYVGTDEVNGPPKLGYPLWQLFWCVRRAVFGEPLHFSSVSHCVFICLSLCFTKYTVST